MQSVGQKNKNPLQNAPMLQLQKALNTKKSQLQKLNREFTWGAVLSETVVG